MDVAGLRSRWDKFELMLESHDLMIQEQIQVMRGNMASRVEGDAPPHLRTHIHTHMYIRVTIRIDLVIVWGVRLGCLGLR